jgi:hypothetical protein
MFMRFNWDFFLERGGECIYYDKEWDKWYNIGLAAQGKALIDCDIAVVMQDLHCSERRRRWLCKSPEFKLTQFMGVDEEMKGLRHHKARYTWRIVGCLMIFMV